MNYNLALILAKIEGSYGVDSVPTAGSNAILTEDLTVEPISEDITRNYVRSFYGTRDKIINPTGWSVKFKTELKGSGTASTPPEYGVLFRAANYTQTISTYVDYDPNSAFDTAESCTIYAYRDGILHKILGCRCVSWKISMKAGKPAYIDWELQGTWATPIDGSMGSPTYSTTVPPRLISASFTIDSYAGIVDGIDVESKQGVSLRTSANAATGVLGRNVSTRDVTGKIDPEVVTLATKNFWTTWEASTRVAFTATLGASAGNRLIITAPKVQYDKMSYANRNDYLVYGIGMNFTPNAGNDELKLRFS